MSFRLRCFCCGQTYSEEQGAELKELKCEGCMGNPPMRCSGCRHRATDLHVDEAGHITWNCARGCNP